jgi:hypothetical protein
MFIALEEAIDNLLIIEIIIVVTEAAFIKLVSRFDAFQWESFQGFGWLAAFIISTLSNIVSYLVGGVLVDSFI